MHGTNYFNNESHRLSGLKAEKEADNLEKRQF